MSKKQNTETQKCRVCGCTWSNACVNDDGTTCYWVSPDLCSSCAGTAAAKARPLIFRTDSHGIKYAQRNGIKYEVELQYAKGYSAQISDVKNHKILFEGRVSGVVLQTSEAAMAFCNEVLSGELSLNGIEIDYHSSLLRSEQRKAAELEATKTAFAKAAAASGIKVADILRVTLMLAAVSDECQREIWKDHLKDANVVSWKCLYVPDIADEHPRGEKMSN